MKNWAQRSVTSNRPGQFHVRGRRPDRPATERATLGRLDQASTTRLLQVASEAGILVNPMSHASDRLQAIRNTYEPYLAAIGVHVLIDLPPWLPADDAEDNWETTAWDFNSPRSYSHPTVRFAFAGSRRRPMSMWRNTARTRFTYGHRESPTASRTMRSLTAECG